MNILNEDSPPVYRLQNYPASATCTSRKKLIIHPLGKNRKTALTPKYSHHMLLSPLNARTRQEFIDEPIKHPNTN